MRRVLFGTIVWLSLALSFAGCGDDDRARRDGAVGGDASGGPCTDGQITCLGLQVRVCNNGVYEPSMMCTLPEVCGEGVGCRMCAPERNFCLGQEIRACNADGTESTLVRECPPDEVCQNGVCRAACAAAAEERSNMGCDYFAVDLDNEYGTAADEPFAVVLANPSAVTVQAMVTMSVSGRPNVVAETLVNSYTVPPNGLVRIDLPSRHVDGSTDSNEGPGTYLSNQAYRIRTNFPVVAYQFNPIVESASNDASLLLPVPALDTHYRVLGWPTSNPIEVPGLPHFPGIPDHSYVTIIGTEEATMVRVTMGGDMIGGEFQGGGSIPARSAGEVVEITLGPFDVLNLESTGIPGDLSGTVVESTRPVVVFSGGERGTGWIDGLPPHPTGEPDDVCCTEHLEEQVFPTSSWGKNFVITRSPVRSDHATWQESDIYRLIADKNNTVVTTSLPAPFNQFTLSENEWVEFHAATSFVMTSTEPVSIEQILLSQGAVVSWKSGHGGDPSMILFPPFEQYRDDYIFLVPDTFSSNYVVVSAPEGANFTLDGTTPMGCTTESVGLIEGTAYNAFTCLVEGGSHRVISDVPVGIMVYGYHNVGSYGYAGGSNLTRINFI